MAVYFSINKNDLLLLLKEYDVGTLEKFEGILEGIENTNYLINTSKNTFILTIFGKRVNKKDLPFFINLKRHLIEKNFPCPQPITNKKGKSISSLKGKSYVIISFLNGSKTDKITNDHCYQVGKMLSSLHNKSLDFEQKRSNGMNYSKWEQIFCKCQKSKNHKYLELIEPIKKELNYLKKNWPVSLPNGIIHGDVFHDNVFFKNNQFSGLIDFYFACNDFFSYDIALTINAWCFENKNEFDQKKFQSLIGGYEVHRSLIQEEKNIMSILLRGAAVRILLTRLHDQLFHPIDAFVKPKDPLEYFSILKFHQKINIKNYLS